MVNVIAWIKQHLPTKRRLIQLYSALLFTAHIKGFIKGEIFTGKSKMLCVPGLNCYSCPGATGACPLGALQNALASSGNRAPTYILGILLLYGLILGRTICGYLCPFGLIQELLHKIPTPKLRKNRITRILSWLKYIVLLIFVLVIPLWYSLQRYPVPAFCKYICPAGTLEGAVGLLSNPSNADKFSMLGILFTRKFLILLLVIAVCIFTYRAFCRFLCPLGAIYGLFSKVAIIGVKVDNTHCTDCGRCVHVCKMDIRKVGDHECIHCGECIDHCPENAISLKAGKYTIQSPQRIQQDSPKSCKGKTSTHLVLWISACLFLVASLIMYNLPDKNTVSSTALPSSTTSEETITEATVTPQPQNIGYEVGMRAPAFKVPIYGQDTDFVLDDNIGKTVVINFWATWCTPCCNELPYFDEIHRLFGDSVVVIAIHSNLVTDDVEGYLKAYAYQMPFAFDETGEVIKAYGGSTMLPQTIIINPEGIITYNAVGSLTSEKLNTLINQAQTPTAQPALKPANHLKH